MRSHRFARVGLTAVGFALAAAALAGCGGGSSGTPTTQKKPVEPPTILSPRKGDVMGYTFDVARTYVNSGTTVTVTASDRAGNISMCTFDVTVVDTTPPTVQLTAHLRSRPAPGWLRIQVESRAVHGMWFDSDATVVDSTGRLVCQARQLALSAMA